MTPLILNLTSSSPASCWIQVKGTTGKPGKLFGKENYKAGKGCQSWGRCMNIHDCSSAQQHIHFPVPPSQHHLCLLVFTSASPEKRIQWFWCIQLTVGSSFFMFTQWVWAGARELYQSAKPLAVAGTPKVSVLLSSKTVGGRPKRVLNCATTTPIKGSNSWPTTSQALQFVQDAILCTKSDGLKH